MVLLIFLSEVELLHIDVHFSYACAAHGMFFPLSYAQLGATQRRLSYAHQHAASSNLDFLFVSSEFSAYILVDLVIKYFLYK